MKKLLCMLLTVLMVIPSVACFGTVEEELDSTKTHIFVKVFNGGMGTEWMEDLKNQFNSVNDKYDIVARYEKQTSADILAEIERGKPSGDIYLSTSLDFQSGIYMNYFEDLSDILNVKPDGESGRTVKQKIRDYDEWKMMASKYGQGLYILPHTDAILGMVFDYKLFVENEWLTYADEDDIAALTAQGITFTQRSGKLLFESATGKVNYAQGDIILKPGKDGKYGTYDDGQPKTVAEFDNMIREITQGNKKAKSFVYSGMYDTYLNEIVVSAMAQYMGIDLYKSYYYYDSKGAAMPMHDGSSAVINLDNGYKVFNCEGLYQGLSFATKYFNDRSNVYKKSFSTTSYSHTDAQDSFLLGYKNEQGFPAMLCDGTWWENEAKPEFESIVKEGNADRGYGKREYRYMLIPEISGQALPVDQTVFNSSEIGGLVVVKQEDSEKLAKIKEFIALTLKDENLAKFTELTGTMKNYDYSLTSEQLNNMTPFARNCYEMYKDTEHITITKSKVYKYSDPCIFTAEMTPNYVPLLSGATYTMYAVRYFRDGDTNIPVDNVFGTDNIGYSSAKWNEFLSKARAQGFFAN